MSRLTSIAGFDSPWFAKTAEDAPITRKALCLCGREFVQGLLSKRFTDAVERQGQRAVSEVLRQIPELYVPVNCPSCERRAIAHEARRAGVPSFAEAAD